MAKGFKHLYVNTRDLIIFQTLATALRDSRAEAASAAEEGPQIRESVPAAETLQGQVEELTCRCTTSWSEGVQESTFEKDLLRNIESHGRVPPLCHQDEGPGQEVSPAADVGSSESVFGGADYAQPAAEWGLPEPQRNVRSWRGGAQEADSGQPEATELSKKSSTTWTHQDHEPQLPRAEWGQEHDYLDCYQCQVFILAAEDKDFLDNYTWAVTHVNLG